MFKQTLFFTLAQLAGRIIGFFLLVVLAGNVLGAKTYGVFANLDTYLMVMLIISTFGADLWLSRHVANHRLTWQDLWRMVLWRSAMTLLILVVFWLSLRQAWIGSILTGYESEMVVFFASLFFDHVALTCTAVLEGRQRLTGSATLSLSRWVTLGIVGAVLLWRHESLMALCVAFLAAAAARAVFGLVLASRHLHPSTRLPVRFKPMIQASLPMALMNFMVVLYFHIDVLMLPEMTSAEETAWYKIAVLMIEAILFVSAGVATALYPLFSKKELNLEAKVDHLYRGMRFLLVLAFPIAWGTMTIADELLVVMFPQKAGEYQNSAIALSWVVWALPAMFVNSSLVRLFLGLERQTRVLLLVSITAMLNVVLNLMLIPKWGYLAACWTTILSEFSLTTLFFINLKKLLPSFKPFRHIWPPAILGAVVWPVSTLTRDMSIWLAILLSVLVYTVLIISSRILTRSDLVLFAKTGDGEPFPFESADSDQSNRT